MSEFCAINPTVGFPDGSMEKNSPANAGDAGLLSRKDPLEKEMVTHSCLLAWRIPRTEEPGGLQSMGSQRVGRDRATERTHVRLGCSHTSSPSLAALCPVRGSRDQRSAWCLKGADLASVSSWGSPCFLTIPV